MVCERFRTKLFSILMKGGWIARLSRLLAQKPEICVGKARRNSDKFEDLRTAVFIFYKIKTSHPEQLQLAFSPFPL